MANEPMANGGLIRREDVARILTDSAFPYEPQIERAMLDLLAVDVVLVVRCRNCKFYNTTGCSYGFGWCEDAVVNTGVCDDFYCARGERRTDA